tara:strand:+ start:157 stop:693 length:537 start_codon:yes stop_codon:yes gene_type:complete
LNCPSCNHNLKNLEILICCEKCNAWFFSDEFIRTCKNEHTITSVNRPTDEDMKELDKIISKFDWIFNEKNEIYAKISSSKFQSTVWQKDIQGFCTYAIKLDGSWEKDGVIFDHYIGQTGKHPAIRFLTHLLDNKKRSLSMKYIQEINFFLLDNNLKRLAEEDALAKKYIDNGYKVYWS